MNPQFKRFYDRARILFYMLKIKGFRQKKYPFYVNLVINSMCNLKCAYCFGKYHGRKTSNTNLNFLKDLIAELKLKKTKYILIQGGEPFLHPDLGKIISFLNDNNIISAVSSNGQFPEKIKTTPEIELMDNICFSLDGSEQNNDKVRGKGVFQNVMESIEKVKKYYSTPIRIKTTVHKFVKDDVDFMAEFAKKNKVEWGMDFLFLGNEKLDDEPLGLSKEELLEYISSLLEYKKKGYPIFITSKILKYAADWPFGFETKYVDERTAKNKTRFKPIECQYGNYEIVIDEDNKVYPCQAMQGAFNAKSIIETNFDEAFDNLKNRICYTCYTPSLINTSAMINWDFKVILETIFDTVRIKL